MSRQPYVIGPCGEPGCILEHGVRPARPDEREPAGAGDPVDGARQTEASDNPDVSEPVTGLQAGKPNRPRGTAESPAHPGRREDPSPAVRGHSRASIPVEVRARREFSPARGE